MEHCYNAHRMQCMSMWDQINKTHPTKFDKKQKPQKFPKTWKPRSKCMKMYKEQEKERLRALTNEIELGFGRKWRVLVFRPLKTIGLT